MRRLVFAAIAAVAVLGASISIASAQSWKALAMNEEGWGFDVGYDEEEARQNAIDACEIRTGYDCSDSTVSVRVEQWYLAGIVCPRGYNVGGSRHGIGQAAVNAVQKMPRMTRRQLSQCELVFEDEPTDVDEVSEFLSESEEDEDNEDYQIILKIQKDR